MHRILIKLALGAAVALALPSSPLAAQDVKIIVNSANSTSELTADVATKLFLKQAKKFPNGTNAVPVELPKGSGTRSAFLKRIVKRAESAVDTYWQQQIFSGKDVPPAMKASDDEVIAFVKANPGAIGYVSAGASAAGVKVVDVR